MTRFGGFFVGLLHLVFSQIKAYVELRCFIPIHYIEPRHYAFFMARSVL